MNLRSGYDGLLSDFVKQLVEPTLPSAANLLAWHRDLVDHFSMSPCVYPARKWRKEKRGFLTSFAGVTDAMYILTDNTPAIWSFVRCSKGANPGLRRAIGDRTLPIALALQKDERDRANWRTTGAPELDAVYSRRLKHCHILPCNLRNVVVDTVAELRRRSARLLSPMNHFLWPSPRHYSMFLHAKNGRIEVDLGERSEVIAWIRWILYANRLRAFASEVDEALVLLGDREKIPLATPTDFRIEILPREKVAHTGSPILDLQGPVVDAQTLISRLPNDYGGRIDSDVNLCEASNRCNSQAIAGSRVSSSFVWKLGWKLRDEHDEPEPVGTFRLDLAAILDAGLVKRQADGKIRLIVWHDDDGFNIRLNRSAPRARIAERIAEDLYFADD
jgi:hypothetical protein